MSDPVEIILAFLRRHQFEKAEAAFKTELLAREKGEVPLSPSENVSDWHPSSSHGFLQNRDSVTDAPNGAMVISVPGKDVSRVSSSKERDTVEEVRSPPEKQLYVEYELAKPSLQDSLCTASQEFAFGEVRPLQKFEAPVFCTEAPVSFPVQAVDAALQGASWITSFQQVEESLPGMQNSSSAKPLLSENSVWKANGEPAEHGSEKCSEGMKWQLHYRPNVAFNGILESEYGSQHRKLHTDEPVQKELDVEGEESELPCNTFIHSNVKHKLIEGEKLAAWPHWNEVQAPRRNLPARKKGVETSTDLVQDCGEGSSWLQSGSLTSSTCEGIVLPVSLSKPSENIEQERLLTPDLISLKNEVVEAIKTTALGTDGNQINQSHILGPSVAHQSGELPRLPPVRLHSIDKNIDTLKKDGLFVGNESSSRNQALPSIEVIPAEDYFGAIDIPLGQDITGLKRRPSVSQGIVEALPEQLLGFANCANGQGERWCPDEYCDSDTYEDDDDPGYHRQPIADEEWFLAHEIDYPSDDERSRQHIDKTMLSVSRQSKKVDEDDRSFVEEESYFSGEEYYRLQQAAKKEFYNSQQSELRNLGDEHFTSIDSYSARIGNGLSTLSTGGIGGDKISGQTFDGEEMRPQPVWKGFIGSANELDQGDAVFGDSRYADGVDDDNHGSVRSGGILVSSDVADIGSEVRDSLLGGSSEGDAESLKEQDLVRFDSQEFFINEKQGGVEVRSASVKQLKEDIDQHDMVLQYYNEAWGLCKRATEREVVSKSTFGSSLSNLSQSKHLKNCNNKGFIDNGGSVFGGFSFPSPSSTGDVALSTAGSGKSLWSNRESTAQGDETDGFGNGIVGPDDTLAAWKQKSYNSSPIICSSEDNLMNFNLPKHSPGSCHSTDDCVSLEAKEHGIDESDVGSLLPKICQPIVQEDEDDLAGQEEMRTLAADEDQYEIFNLRIIHRKNRTGFEEEKEFPVVLNSVIAGRYHVTEYLGSAAFSKAIQAHDLHTGMDVCMKIIKNNKDFFDQSLDEIKLLKFVNKHDPIDKYHILRLYDYFYHREHLFIVCELLRANLYEFHKFNRESGGEVYFTMSRLQSITRQCLEALEFLHRLGVIHCDLKPENILVKSYSRCEIKIIDLGSSCFQTDHLCSYVQSRSYRAPEVILGLPYDQKIDIWSLGCILAELCTGNVLFQNDSLATLLARVVGILGPFDPEVLAKGRDTYKYFTKNHMLYERNQETDQLEYLLPKKTSLSHRLPMGDQGFVEFVGYLLQSNPSQRPTATEALLHPWLSCPYDPISS